ncbi:hypothetical protein LCGC14_2748020 [marine sediment metagenome]|uniref:Uncharacterized protein n=1 Tax=marine sediment metagenome TaxID=412755 RepID=A0A0F8Z2I8_9ZZZZ
MTPAITLSPEEKAIVERQCEGCKFWNLFAGCLWLEVYEPENHQPIRDCGAFEVRP